MQHQRRWAICSLIFVIGCGSNGGTTAMPGGAGGESEGGRGGAAVKLDAAAGGSFVFPGERDAAVDPVADAGCVGANCPTDAPVSQCGDGSLDADETCDDRNAVPGDGCSGLCRVEPNFACPDPGAACVSTVVCGDSKVTGGEGCDDGDKDPMDGCSATCQVEQGFACQMPGSACVPVITVRCGDGKVNQGETCDDGGTVSVDGCSGTCQIEAGFTCAQPGQLCVRNEFCGDGVLNSSEACDDKNSDPGDGCTGTCKLEPFFTCPVAGMACTTTIICGDRNVVADEACDDGNTVGTDGCAADCKQIEPGFTCPKAAGVGGPCTPVPMLRCGDSRLSFGEFCDDGNPDSLDGCSSTCRVEPGYTCDAPGTTCTLVEWCGNGKLSVADGEQCDDNGQLGGDGCSAICVIEADFVCPDPGLPCQTTVVCSDGRITGAETCDDGNTTPNDGCSAVCMLQNGWTCPQTGSPCRAALCGDGIIAGVETCDDGGPVGGDGCSAACRLETPGPTEDDGWVCPTVGAACVRTDCGDGVREGSEQCDLGDNNSGDGCSPFCRREPLCPATGGPCNTACGDGLLLPVDITNGQQCDDGNTQSGDGCSATCTVENGYACTEVAVVADPLILPVVYRDLKASYETNGHPDFQSFGGEGEVGIVEAMLGLDGKPKHVAVSKNHTVNNDTGITQDFFSYWWNDTPAYTRTMKDTLTFTRLGTGEYRFDDSSFFPIDNQGWGNFSYVEGGMVRDDHNFHFSSEVRYWFEYKGGEQLDFTGDDDLWVFINKRLAVDLGGLHPPRSGSVILANDNSGSGSVCDFLTTPPSNNPPACRTPRIVDLGLEKGKVYEIVVFQAERHTSGSNYRLTLSNFAGTRSQCDPVCGDGVVTPNEACDLGTAKNTGAYGTCNANCTLPARCGDGSTSNGEQCDDGVNRGTYLGTVMVCAPGCVFAPYCGDLKVDSAHGEACDQGPDNGKGYGYCSATCRLGPRCGDGAVTNTEQCDDGAAKNGTSASKCMDDCQWKCGNGAMDAGEECDAGAALNTGGYGKCKMDCSLDLRCGDGIKTNPEACDDGRNDGSYGTCAPMCVFGPRCGDAMVQMTAGETCDLGAGNAAGAYGKDKCTTQCRVAPFCGNRSVDVANQEKCDDGVNSGQPGSCSVDCKDWVPLPFCGDGKPDPGEVCDTGAANGTAPSTCDARCKIKCGNGAVDAGEQCDDGVNSGAYGTCKNDCTLAEYCGDGTQNGPAGRELCDKGMSNEVDGYGVNKCSTLCQPAPYCGDGRIQANWSEQCDGQANCNNLCKIVIIE